ncbi:DNA-(apurinic or apyrimidinic site) lyase, partial [Xylaria longipes]
MATSPPRRITRSSLARFAYTSTPHSASAGKSQDGHPPNPDIEDIIPDVTPSSTSSVRKRKRTTAVSVPRAARLRAARGVKNEVNTEIKTGPEVKIKVESEDVAAAGTSPAKPTKRQRKPARKTTDPSTGESTISPPTDWEEMYAVVQSMRGEGGAASDAPVDTMGCERLALTTASPRDQRFQTLVALMLSSQTKDTVNAV